MLHFSANTEVKTGDVLYNLLKIDQQIKGRLVDEEVFILLQKKAPRRIVADNGI